MKFTTKKPSLEEVKELDLVSYLSRLGHEPTKIRNSDYWYLSPLRDEKTASFKVNRSINRWYDHGLGTGGNIIDFGTMYFRCTVGEFMRKIDTNLFFHQPILNPSESLKPPPKIIVLQDFSIGSFGLVKYLGQRKIPLDIANQFCREVHYDLDDKKHNGIGFKNDSGGWEIRTPYLKTSDSPKDVTTFKNGGEEVYVFEGFVDFLSFKVLYQNHPGRDTNFLILNSLSFFEKARPYMENHQSIRLYLDRDSAGQNCSRHAMSLKKNIRMKVTFTRVIKM